MSVSTPVTSTVYSAEDQMVSKSVSNVHASSTSFLRGNRIETIAFLAITVVIILDKKRPRISEIDGGVPVPRLLARPACPSDRPS
jgi:hypothetical protein